MNREQAEHILDAYLLTCRKIDADGIYPDSESEKARDALREVILDAMTEYRVKSNYPSITYPYATWVDTTKLPTNWDDTPKVTYMGGDRVRYDGEIVELGKCIKAQATCPDYTPKVTCTGIDPAFNANTVSTVDGLAMEVGYHDGVVRVVGE